MNIYNYPEFGNDLHLQQNRLLEKDTIGTRPVGMEILKQIPPPIISATEILYNSPVIPQPDKWKMGKQKYPRYTKYGIELKDKKTDVVIRSELCVSDLASEYERYPLSLDDVEHRLIEQGVRTLDEKRTERIRSTNERI